MAELKIQSLTERLLPTYERLAHEMIDELHSDNSWANEAVKAAYSIKALKSKLANRKVYFRLSLTKVSAVSLWVTATMRAA